MGPLIESRVRQRLADLESAGLRRSLRPPSGIDLTSNDYLNLSAHPVIVSRFMAALAREGAGSTGSRLLRGERDAFSAVERRFAGFKGAERSLYFSSGYLANLAVLPTLAEPGDTIYSDAANHASLIDAARLSRAQVKVFPHNDVGELERLLREGNARGGAPRASYVVVESLFSMDGDEAPLAAYARVCREAGAVLVVDEAHAVGVYGSRGSGLIEECGLDRNACVSISTAGKALGVAGAFVAGPSWIIEYLMQRARTFVFSTAAPPAIADAIDASLTIINDEPERRASLRERAGYLRTRLSNDGIDIPDGRSQIIPVVIGGNEQTMTVASALQLQGFDVRAIRPPSVPAGTARLRISVNAALSERTLHRLSGALARALREAGVCSAVSS